MSDERSGKKLVLGGNLVTIYIFLFIRIETTSTSIFVSSHEYHARFMNTISSIGGYKLISMLI